MPQGASAFRETWYVARSQVEDTNPVYRVYASSVDDSMDSPITNEDPGYTLQITHGYAWSGQLPGTQAMTRYINPTLFDHRTVSPLESAPSGYELEATWDDTTAFPRFAFPRHGTLLEECNYADLPAFQDVLDNGVFEARFQRVSGGYLERLKFKSQNRDLIQPGIGAGIQAAIFTDSGAEPSCMSCCAYNPTEAGGTDTWNNSNTKRYSGSPILGTNQYDNARGSEVRPMNFGHHVWSDTDSRVPLLWRGALRRVTSLGVTASGQNFSDVVGLSAEARADSDAPEVMSMLHNLTLGYWIYMSNFGNGNTESFEIDLVDLANGNTTPISFPQFNASTLPCSLSCDGKGILVSKADGSFALGFVSYRPGFYSIGFFCAFGIPQAGDCAATQMLVMGGNEFVTLTGDYWPTARVDHSMVAGSRSSVLSRMLEVYPEFDPLLFFDGFDSGGTGAWSSTCTSNC